MPVSDEKFAELMKLNPDIKDAADAKAAQPKLDAEAEQRRNDQETGTIKAAAENIKAGYAGGAELANAGVRIFAAALNPQLMFRKDDSAFPAALRSGAARKAIVDQEAIDKEGSVMRMFGPALEGIGGIFSMPSPVPVKAGANMLAETASWAAKQIVHGMGMGEGGEFGKWVFGNLGELVAGEKGRQIGEWLGSTGGAAVGAQANVIRMNAVSEIASKGTQAVKATAGSVAPAMKEMFAAKKAGDTRGNMAIFLDHYSDLRDKSVGLVQDVTNRNLANIIGQDPRHTDSLRQFAESLTRTGIDEADYSLGQKAANPTLTQMEMQQKLTKEQAAAKDAQSQRREKGIVNAYERITTDPLPTTTADMKDSAEIYRLGTVAQADKLIAANVEIEKQIPNWNPNQVSENGGRLRDLRDQEHAARKLEDDKNYQGAYNAADAAGARIDLAPVLKDTRKVLEPLLSQVDSPTAPNSIRALNQLLIREKNKAAKTREADDNRPFYMKDKATEPTQVKGHSLQEVDDVIKQLNSDAHNAFRTKTVEGDKVGANLNQIVESLQRAVDKSLPKEVADMYVNARQEYRNKTAPRFKEGIAYNLKREAAASRRGRDQIDDQHVIPAYLNQKFIVDNMNQFDATFGDTHGGKKNAEAYKILGDGVADRYSKEVLQDGFTQKKHDTFMRDWSPALDRVPDVRKSLERDAQQIDMNIKKQELLRDNYRDVMGLPITKAISNVQAEHMLIQALSDSSKMEKILGSPMANTPEAAQSLMKELSIYAHPLKGGKFDPDALVHILTSGENRPGQMSSLQMLAEKALGPEAGREHIANLHAIAELMRRDALTDTKYMRFNPMVNKGPVEAGSGQSMSSWVSMSYAMEQGRIGKPFALTTAASRFINNEMQKATTHAMERALYDPEMSKAVLELAQTPSNQQVSYGAFKTVYGGMKGFTGLVKNLADHGLVRMTLARGALYGVSSETGAEEAKPKKPKRVLDLPR